MCDSKDSFLSVITKDDRKIRKSSDSIGKKREKLVDLYEGLVKISENHNVHINLVSKLRLALLSEEPLDVSFQLLELKENSEDKQLHLALAYYYRHLNIDTHFADIILSKLSKHYQDCVNYSNEQFIAKIGDFFYDPLESADSNDNSKLSTSHDSQSGILVDEKSVCIDQKTYKLSKVIGKGGFSTVYLANNCNHEPCVVKITPLEQLTDSEINNLRNEAKLLSLANSFNDRVVAMFDYEQAETEFRMAMEFGQDLNTYLANTSKMYLREYKSVYSRLQKTASFNIPLHTLKFIWAEMLLCVNALHQNELVHLDLKLDNFILVNGILKLIDLGQARLIPDDSSRLSSVPNVGTVTFMSPEQVASTCYPEMLNKVGKKSDIWSLGICLYYMIFGQTPYENSTEDEKFHKLLDKGWNVSIPSSNFCPVLIKSLYKCLLKDVEHRADVEELLNIIFNS